MKYTVKRFSQRGSLEDIYKTILNPIILEADKVYGKKSLYIPRLLENGEIKEGKTLLIGQHPNADLKSDSCYEIFDGLWKDSSGKYWTEKSGFLGRKTWKEVEDPKKYMSEIYRGFNISSRDLSKVCGNLSKAIYEDSLDNIKRNPQYWKLPEIKYFSIFSKFFPKKKESLPESNLLEIIENFPKIKKDIQNLQRNQNKIKELGEKLIDLGMTNGNYHPGLFKETSWIDNSGWAILIEGTDMEGSLLINTKTGKLEDCMGNKFNGVPSYLKFLIKSTDTLLDPVLAKEDDYYIFDDSKKVYDDCVKVWKELKPLLK